MGQARSKEARADMSKLRRTYSKSYMNHNNDSRSSFGFYYDLTHYDLRVEFDRWQ